MDSGNIPIQTGSGSTSQQPYGFTSGDHNEQTYAILAHASAAAGMIGVPLGFLVGPLIIYLVYGKVSAFVEANARESVNFQISLMIYMAISAVLMFVLVGFILAVAVTIFGVVQVVIASMKARDGYLYQYPLCIRFIK